MRLKLGIIGMAMFMLAALGCNTQPTYVAQQQPQTVGSACTNAQGIVVDDNWCDANYIAQQRQIAIATHNQQMLNDLLLYHLIYSSTPYTLGMYVRPGSYYNYAPRGYVVQRRSVYVTHVHNNVIVNHSSPNTNNYRSSTYNHSYSNSTSSHYSSPTTSSPSYRSTPSRSYSSSSSRSYSSSRRR